MTTKAKKKAVKPRGKQHDVRSASFLRIAKQIEGAAVAHSGTTRYLLQVIGMAFRDEAGLLRGMR